MNTQNNRAGLWAIIGFIAFGLVVFSLFYDGFATLKSAIKNNGEEDNFMTAHFALINPIFWMKIAPQIGFASAIFSCSLFFLNIKKGHNFTQSIVKCLREIGLQLIFAAIIGIAFNPYLTHEVPYDRATHIAFMINFLTFLIIGIALFIVADQGKKLKNELDEIV